MSSALRGIRRRGSSRRSLFEASVTDMRLKLVPRVCTGARSFPRIVRNTNYALASLARCRLSNLFRKINARLPIDRVLLSTRDRARRALCGILSVLAPPSSVRYRTEVVPRASRIFGRRYIPYEIEP